MSFRKNSGVDTRFVIALLLGAGLFAAGCSCTCPKYIGSTGPEPVNVLVTWNPELGKLVVFPDAVRVCEGKQFVRWIVVGEGRGLTIEFLGESPFLPGALESPASAKREASGTFYQSGVSKPGTAGKRYKYTVNLRVPGLEKPAILDPFVEIDR